MVLAVARFVLAAAAIILVVWMFSVGLAPEVGLARLFAFFGAVLALPVLAYVAVTVQSVTALARHRSPGVTFVTALSGVDVLVGLWCVQWV